MTRNEYYERIEEAADEFIWVLDDDVFDNYVYNNDDTGAFQETLDALTEELVAEIGSSVVMDHSGNWKAYHYEYGVDALVDDAGNWNEVVDTFAFAAVQRDLMSRWAEAIKTRTKTGSASTAGSSSRGSKRGRRMKKI